MAASAELHRREVAAAERWIAQEPWRRADIEHSLRIAPDPWCRAEVIDDDGTHYFLRHSKVEGWLPVTARDFERDATEYTATLAGSTW